MAGIAVGDQGTLITTEDGGRTWKQQDSGTTKNLKDISVGEDELFAVGDDGVAVKYKIPMITQYPSRKLLFGEQEPALIEPEIIWETIHMTGSGAFREICFISAYEGWIAGDDMILHTIDGGKVWDKQTSSIDAPLIGIHFVSSELGWAMATDGTVLSTSNGGRTWQVQNDDSKPVMDSYDPDMNPVKMAHQLKAVHFQSSSEGWAVGKGGAILHNVDGGPVWIPQDSKSRTTFNDVQFVGDRYGWAVGLWGVIAFTNDAGATWLTQSSNTSYDLNGLHFVDASEGWAVGRDGIILHTTNSGVDWLSQDSGVSESLNAVHFTDNEEGWIIGNNGLVLHTHDGGLTWQREGSGTDRHLYDIWYIEENGLVAVGAESTIIKRLVDEPYP
jgi:photosystem II stability/assembly factor-like uncharacterized protein